MFISPTEPPMLLQIGAVSLLPEEYGVDIMWQSKLGTIGVQRKQFPSDFLISIQDGRLSKEYQQMKALDIPILLLEGNPRWTLDGELYGDTHRGQRLYQWSRLQHRNYLASVQLRGIQVHTSESITDTIDYINGLRLWSNKEDHHGLDRRPAAKGGIWGNVTNGDYVRYLYQSLPGVGPKQAGAIYQRLGMIFRLDVGEDELQSVPGIGKGRARKIMEVFRNV